MKNWKIGTRTAAGCVVLISIALAPCVFAFTRTAVLNSTHAISEGDLLCVYATAALDSERIFHETASKTRPPVAASAQPATRAGTPRIRGLEELQPAIQFGRAYIELDSNRGARRPVTGISPHTKAESEKESQ